MRSLRRFPTSLPVALSIAVTAAMAACTTDGAVITGTKTPASLVSPQTSPAVTGTPAGTGLTGTVPGEGGTATPVPSGSPIGGGGTGATPSPTPTRSASPSPTPTHQAYSAFSTEVTVSPSSATLYVAAADGDNEAGYSTSTQLTAQVLLSNSTKNTLVSWTSTAQDVAQVDSSGKVTSGKAGTATIWATSLDGYAAGSCSITVKDDAALDVTIR